MRSNKTSLWVEETGMLKPHKDCGRRLIGLAIVAMFLGINGESQTKSSERGVRVIANETAGRVDVLIDGKPFTSYIWRDEVKKPVLYPLRTASGVIVTRGYPVEPR